MTSKGLHSQRGAPPLGLCAPGSYDWGKPRERTPCFAEPPPPTPTRYPSSLGSAFARHSRTCTPPRTWPRSWTRPTPRRSYVLRSELKEPDRATWLLFAEEHDESGTAAARPIGYVSARPARLPHPEVAAGDGEVQRLYVLREYQGGGRGTLLLETALAWLERRGPRTLWIGVWSENLGAQRLYERHGFAIVGEYSFMVGSHADREFVARRECGH